MKRNYVATDLKTFINESKIQKSNDKLNEGCNCGKDRPNRPSSEKKATPTKTELPKTTYKSVGVTKSGIPTIKQGTITKGKINESEAITAKIKKAADDIKKHKYSAILESSCKEETKITLLESEGVTTETANSIIEGYNKRVNFIKLGLEKLETLNEGFELVEDEIDNTEDYDFKDRRHGQLETGLYDSTTCGEMDEEDLDISTATVTEDGFDEDEELLGGEETLDGGDEVDMSDVLDDEEDGLGDDESLDGDELDQVGEEVEIKKFVFGVDNVQGAIEELAELGIDASEFSEDAGDEGFGETSLDGDMGDSIDHELSDEEVEGEDFSEEGTSDFSEEDDYLGESATSRIYEGEIIIDVENWGDEQYDAFTQWLEMYDINPEDIFGDEGEIEVSDVETEDFTDNGGDEELEVSDETFGEEDSFGDDSEYSEESFSDYEDEEIQ